MSRRTWLISAVCACLTVPAYASNYQLDSLVPLDNQELSGYRAGFFSDDFMINIGLDIATSINGETMFNNNIANLFFQNGQLVATEPEVLVPTTTVVQVGEGNSFSLPNSNVVPPSTTQPQISVSQVTAPLPSVTQTAINRVIQNSLDGTVIGFETIVNVDAQVNGALRRLERSNKLHQSLQFNFN